MSRPVQTCTELLAGLRAGRLTPRSRIDDGIDVTRFAAASGCADLLRECVKAGIEIGDSFVGGYTSYGGAAISDCAMGDPISLITWLLVDVSPDSVIHEGGVTLLMAAAMQSPVAVGVLLAAGATADLADEDGQTALMVACNSQTSLMAHADRHITCRLLLASGASRSITSRRGWNAGDYCRKTSPEPLCPVCEEMIGDDRS